MFAQAESFFTSYTFMGIMAVLLAALLGVFFYMRKQNPDD